MTRRNGILSPRWRKLARDLKAERDRLLLMLAAVTVSLLAVGAILGAYAVLTREILANYLGTRPAAATLVLKGDVDTETLALARRHPAIAEAEARDVVRARARVGDDWRPLLLFVVDDFSDLRLNTFTFLDGAEPPATGSLLLERTAGGVLEAGVGDRLLVRTTHGSSRETPVAGWVHDPGLAPAWQERTGYGYISRPTLSSLGEPPVLHELRIALYDDQAKAPAVEEAAFDLATQLRGNGRAVHEIRVPPPRQHPHQRQMTTVLFLMLAFSLMALVLSSILVASSLSAILARQVREIGVMKAVGARAAQIAGMYASLVAALGAAAVTLALPGGLIGARILSKAVADLLNFRLTDPSVPLWVLAVQAAAGILVPLAVALGPVVGTSRKSVRGAIDQHGVAAEGLRLRTARLPRPARDALRRPARLALTVSLLAAGGAMFMTALNVKESWERTIAKVSATRHYDVEVRLDEPRGPEVARRLGALPEVAHIEAWGYSPAALVRRQGIDLVRTYPDRGHASLTVLAPPAITRLVSFPVLAGRWLRDDDTDTVVLNHAVAAQLPGLRVRDRLDLSLDGHEASWSVAGIVEEIGSVGAVYVTAGTFQRLTGTEGRAQLLRIATQPATERGRLEAVRAIEQRLEDDGIGIETTTPLIELRSAMADHITILIQSLIALAVVMAAVGALGLTAAMGTSVLERTRELAVMRTLGATPSHLTRLLVAESSLIGLSSWLAALVLALPLTWLVDTLVGQLGFVAPLPWVLAPAPALVWLALVATLSLAATTLPARRAAQLSVAQALTQL